MGCDIHCYIEYKGKNINANWLSFGGRINPGRNYWMFGLLAKVRCEFEESLNPKKLPENLGYSSRQDNLIYISEKGDKEGECTLEQAKKWEGYGCQIIYMNDKPCWVTNPDWHSHSWVNIDEFENVLNFYNEKINKENIKENLVEPEYHAILAAMKKLSEFSKEVRMVFWFDN